MDVVAVFFILPIVSAILYIAFLIAYVRAARKNKLSPGSIREEKQNSYKSLARVFGIIALVTLLIAGGATALLFYAVEHM